MTLIDLDSLKPFHDPRSVAVIGASSDPLKIGGRPIDMLKMHGFDGRIIPINPKSDEIQGLPAFASITDVDGPVDLAICSVPGKLAIEALDACIEKKVGGLIMFTAGFAEVSAEGEKQQEEMARRAARAGMRLMGPNCMGVANMRRGLIGTFHPAFAAPMARDGRIGLVSQSGAFGGLTQFMATQRGIAFSYIFTTGNEADVEASDCLAILANDPDTDVILLYLEGCRNGPKLLEALAMARAANKAVVVIKLGRTEAGAEAAASHTAALAGSDAVFDAVLRQYGAYRTYSIEEFFDTACALAVGGLPPGKKIGLVTVSGGVGVLMADDAESRGLDVVEMPESTKAKMKELVPFAGVRNPLDVTGQVINMPGLFQTAMTLMLEEGGYDAVIGFQGASFARPDALVTAVPVWCELKEKFPDRWIGVTGLVSPEARRALEAAGLPTFPEPTHATRAVAALAAFNELRSRPDSHVEPAARITLPEGPVGELAALEVLRAAGVPTVPAAVAADADAAIAIAREFGYPVVMKIAAPEILHKTEIGGVRLNLADEAAVRLAFAEIIAAARTARPEANITGCLLAPMRPGGVETIIGASRDPVFGPMIMFGLGGVFVEVLEDVSFRVAPFDEAEAHRMIDEIKGRKILDGVRGAPPADIDALAGALSAFSRFVAAHADDIESFEANPFVVFEHGALALDAVLLRR